MAHPGLCISILGAALLAICVGLPQIPNYNVAEVNEEVLDDVDNVEEVKSGAKLIKSEVKVDIPERLAKYTKLNVALFKTEKASVDPATNKYVKVQEKIEEKELSAPDVAGSIAFEVIDEVGDLLGSKGGQALKKMEALLEGARG